MYKIIEFSTNLDLSSFYDEAEKRGLVNNSSQKMLVDCFNNEREKQFWVLYYNDVPVGTVGAHSFDDVMGTNTYRIGVRTCVLTDKLSSVYNNNLKTKSMIIKNQNPTAQFLLPKCIEWCPKGSRMFITSNENEAGTQKLVHNIFGPTMESTGQMRRIKEVLYRGTNQTVWELYPDKFYEQLNKFPRWELSNK